MMYRITTCYETVYTHETDVKIEYTDDRLQALRAFGIYLENPEVVKACIEVVNSEKRALGTGKIIAVYNPR